MKCWYSNAICTTPNHIKSSFLEAVGLPFPVMAGWNPINNGNQLSTAGFRLSFVAFHPQSHQGVPPGHLVGSFVLAPATLSEDQAPRLCSCADAQGMWPIEGARGRPEKRWFGAWIESNGGCLNMLESTQFGTYSWLIIWIYLVHSNLLWWMLFRNQLDRKMMDGFWNLQVSSYT